MCEGVENLLFYYNCREEKNIKERRGSTDFGFSLAYARTLEVFEFYSFSYIGFVLILINLLFY